MSKLHRLNELLTNEQKTLNIPQYRSKVNSSGGNLKYLKKCFSKHPDASPELRELLALPFPKLIAE